MYARTLTSSLYGLSGETVRAEVDCENGMPAFSMVGLANQSVKEARERIQSAVLNCGFKFPVKRITVNLTPANRKKNGSHYDLPIAAALLIASGNITPGGNFARDGGEKTAMLGELTLEGKILPVEGVLPMVIGLYKSGADTVILPSSNLREALPVKGMRLVGVSDLKEAADYISGFDCSELIAPGIDECSEGASDCPDFSDIRGQEAVKRAAAVAAAGMHGLLMVGPPGVGKSMVGKRIPGIMPPITYEEQLEVTQIYSIAGELSEKRPMICKRPYRAPHHGISSASLVGGGSVPRPGEISLAHGGVLFLDELAEFSPSTLDNLRQPMEDGFVTINRVGGKCTFPARFMLVAAMNPCRCGYYGDPIRPCTCNESDRRKYIGKVSGPLLDRIDIHVPMERLLYDDLKLSSEVAFTDTATLRRLVERAIARQKERYKEAEICFNSGLTPALIKKYCSLNEGCSALMEAAYEKMNLSARSYHRILKVARTAADMDGSDEIEERHLLEAISYRIPERFFS